MIPDLQKLGEVALAMILGGLIGAERELADKPAGLRTHMLIAGAAALLIENRIRRARRRRSTNPI